MYKIFRIKRTLRSKYSRKCVKMVLDQIVASYGNGAVAYAGGPGIMREPVR
jgi:hypothetical protein